MDITKDLYDIVAMPMPPKPTLSGPKLTSTQKLKIVIRKLKLMTKRRSVPKAELTPCN